MAATLIDPPQYLELPDMNKINEPDYTAKMLMYIKDCTSYVTRLHDYCKYNGSSKLAGKIVDFPVDDGYAYYMVFSTTPFTLIHIGISPGLQIKPITLNGLRVKHVKDLIKAREEKQKGVN